MKADEIFGVDVRLIGLVFLISGLPALLGLTYPAAAQFVASLILVDPRGFDRPPLLSDQPPAEVHGFAEFLIADGLAAAKPV